MASAFVRAARATTHTDMIVSPLQHFGAGASTLNGSVGAGVRRLRNQAMIEGIRSRRSAAAERRDPERVPGAFDQCPADKVCRCGDRVKSCWLLSLTVGTLVGSNSLAKLGAHPRGSFLRISRVQFALRNGEPHSEKPVRVSQSNVPLMWGFGARIPAHLKHVAEPILLAWVHIRPCVAYPN